MDVKKMFNDIVDRTKSTLFYGENATDRTIRRVIEHIPEVCVDTFYHILNTTSRKNDVVLWFIFKDGFDVYSRYVVCNHELLNVEDGPNSVLNSTNINYYFCNNLTSEYIARRENYIDPEFVRWITPVAVRRFKALYYGAYMSCNPTMQISAMPRRISPGTIMVISSRITPEFLWESLKVSVVRIEK